MGMQPEHAGKAKLGVVYVTSGWFRDVGLQDAESDTTARVGRIADEITENLRSICIPVPTNVIFSEEAAETQIESLLTHEIDAILLVPLMWCEDGIVRACLRNTGDLPLILWTFTPSSTLPEYLEFHTMLEGSGAVCTLQLSGMLKREGRRYYPVVGSLDDEEIYEHIRKISSGMRLKRLLSQVKVGVLPFPCAQMSTTYVDEFGLRSRYGIELRYIELERVRRYAEAITGEELQAFEKNCMPPDCVIKVDDRNLEVGERYAVALEHVIREEQLSVLAMNDVIDEMHNSFGLRPSLANPRIGELGVTISMEADIAAGICMYALTQLTGEPAFYTEVFGVDYSMNALLLGHAGYHDWSNADTKTPIQIISDVEYEQSDAYTGCATYFKYREGPVTVVNSVWDGSGLKWFVFQGTSLPGPAKMEGNCHLFCKVDGDVKGLLSASVSDGVSQHWIVVPGHIAEDIEAACGASDIRYSLFER